MKYLVGITKLDAPTWLRRRWQGHRSSTEIILLFISYVERATSLEIFWR